MFKVRKDEPDYAFIPDVEVPEKNQWGKNINTIDENSELAGQSLHINGDDGVGENPNRYKQHGFHFSADHCIGCHACESACSEKNDLPPHISFRSVGYLEGGSYPAFKRLNISMACNHCDDPVCLKGCPTRAYTKFAEYGAVLQDPDICFGCGYCTWVCPYNAPQLDLSKGQVSKCNMCVDRLEVGLKPACAAACLGGALDFGIIESIPENRVQAKIKIPGFPDPTITNPNIRFQQTKTLPKDMKRTDTMPLHYQIDEQGKGEYKPKTRADISKSKEWNLSKLRSREDPLVVFTLITQAVIGAFLLLFFGPSLFGMDLLSAETSPVTRGLLLFFMIGIEVYGLYTSTMHLGKPHRFYRAFNNLKYSPVSREVASVAIFFNGLLAYAVLDTFPGLLTWLFPDALVGGLATLFGLIAAVMGPVAIYAMHKIYRIKARPFWNHWQVLTSFYGSMLTLGALLVGLFFAVNVYFTSALTAGVFSTLSVLMFIGLVVEAVGLAKHKTDMQKLGGEGDAAMQVQLTKFGKTYRARNIGIVVGALMTFVLASVNVTSELGLIAWFITAAIIIATAVVGRAMFYVLVIPTTMPGAFFWKNAGFQEHARDAGLADMPQAGILPKTDYHHETIERAKREIKEEIQTIKEQGFQKAVIDRFKAKYLVD